MRSFLLDALFKGKATIAPPAPGTAALAEIAKALGQRARQRLGRSLAIREIEQSLGLIEQILARLPDGSIAATLPTKVGSHEGLALVESFRGDVLVWLRMHEGKIARCHLRDPSWFQWPLLEVAVEGNIVADFPLCNKSFNCSYSGHDL